MPGPICPPDDRVVLASVLGCAARGQRELCPNCAAGDYGRCDRVTVGDLKPGLQTGFCSDTGGGWSRLMLAHRSQLWAVPDGMDDRTAVLIEPLACAIHAALRARVSDGDTVLVAGAGTVGLLTLIALRRFSHPGRVIVAAKHPRQRAAASRWPVPTTSCDPNTRSRPSAVPVMPSSSRPIEGWSSCWAGSTWPWSARDRRAPWTCACAARARGAASW